jgi:hypothetical protein
MHVREWALPPGVYQDSPNFPHGKMLEEAGHDLFADAGPALGRIVADWARRVPFRSARPQRP